MMSVGAGMYFKSRYLPDSFWHSSWEKTETADHLDDPARLRWAGIGLAVQLIMVIVMCMFSLRKKKTVHAWSASAARKARPGYVPTVALIAPILPVYCWLY